MKKIISIILVTLFIFALVGCTTNQNSTTTTTQPNEPELKPYCCTKFLMVVSGDTYELTNVGRCRDEHVIIPSTYKDLPVTTISGGAFEGCQNIISITIPTTITTIGNFAFNNCTALVEINYLGTVSEWNKITLNNGWDNNTDEYVIHCKDGEIAKDGTVTYK